MKIITMLAAGLVAVTGLAPAAFIAPAAAQTRTVVTERTVVRHAPNRRATRYDYRRHRAYYRGRHRARRTVCRVERHRYRNVRVCRTVYRR